MSTKKRLRSGDSSIKRSYGAVKQHFTSRLEAFDKILVEHEKASASTKEAENPVKIKPAFYDLIQEGIGTMIMHLPRELAVQTLADFTSILTSNLKASSKQTGADASEKAQRVVAELDNVKTHVLEDNSVSEVFVEPLLLAIAELNGDKTIRDDAPTMEEQKEHDEMNSQQV